MEDKDKKKNVKKIIVYAVLLVLIMGIAQDHQKRNIFCQTG